MRACVVKRDDAAIASPPEEPCARQLQMRRHVRLEPGKQTFGELPWSAPPGPEEGEATDAPGYHERYQTGAANEYVSEKRAFVL